jgi:hypothetical protein
MEEIQGSWRSIRSHRRPIVLYAVTIEPFHTTFFVSERPDDNEWEVQEGVSLDLSPIYGTWTPNLGPLRQVLCVSISDPKDYKIFLNGNDINPTEYRPTGRDFGGLFSKSSWERFAKEVPAAIAFLELGDDEPVGPTEEVVTAIEGRT